MFPSVKCNTHVLRVRESADRKLLDSDGLLKTLLCGH